MRAPDDETKRALGAAIRQARGSRSQKWLAAQLGVDQTSVSQWERGENAPAMSRLSEIEAVLDLEAGSLQRIVWGEAWESLRQRVEETAQHVEHQLGVRPSMAALGRLVQDLDDDEIQDLIELAEVLRRRRRRRAGGS